MGVGAAGSTTAAYRRRIEIVPRPAAIEAEMEDFVHHFAIRIEHHDGVVTRADATGERVPWGTCRTGAAGLASLTGTSLSVATDVDTWAPDRSSQCVHVVDLALLALRHAADAEATHYEIRVTPGWGEHRRAVLDENGRRVLDWTLAGDVATDGTNDELRLARAPFFATLDERGATDREVERAVVLRRACSIALSRGIDLDSFATANEIREADNSCFTFRPEVIVRSPRMVGTTRATEDD
jgi:hypothetical protein